MQSTDANPESLSHILLPSETNLAEPTASTGDTSFYTVMEPEVLGGSLSQESKVVQEIIDGLEMLGLAFAVLDNELNTLYLSEFIKKHYLIASMEGHSLTQTIKVTTEGLLAYKTTLETGAPFSIKGLRTIDERIPDALNVTGFRVDGRLFCVFEDKSVRRERDHRVLKNEHRFRKLSDAISFGLLMVDRSMRITYWNEYLERLTGKLHTEVVGKRILNVLPGISLADANKFRTAFVEGRPLNMGTLKYIDGSVDGVFDVHAFGVENELALLIENRTEQVAAETKLRESEERFRTLSENISLALILVDANGRVTYWNHMSEVTSGGIFAKDVIGKPANEVLPMSNERLERLLRGARKGEEMKTVVEPEKQGVLGTYDIRAFPVGDEVALLLEDVTAHTHQQRQIDQSNRNLLDLYHNAPCGYLSILPDGRIEQINDRMATWLGAASHRDFPKSSIQDILTRASYESFLFEVEHTGFNLPISNLELEFRRKSHEKLLGLVNMLPIYDEVSNERYWRWTVIDVTELREAQRQIEDSRLFTQLFDELGEAVLISDREGRIVRANRAATRILGMPIEQLTSVTHDSPIWQTLKPDGTPMLIAELPGVRALREKQAVSGIELGVIRPDGKLTWILESAAPIFDRQGEVTGVIVIFPEISSSVTQQQELLDLNDRLGIERDRANEANRLKSSFLANMSHEIRTPMTAILGFSDILSQELAGKVSEQHYTFLRSINVSGKRLLSLINDVLDLSKIEAGRLELQNENVEVGNELEAAATPLMFIAKQKKLDLRIQKLNTPSYIRADRQRLNQVLTNLIGNAIKFTRTGWIECKYATESGRVRIDITDTGIGISDAFLPHLFDEFRQEHTGVTREFGGTGLGLAISKKLIGMMNGSIEVSSESGTGTTFSLFFSEGDPDEGWTNGSRKSLFSPENYVQSPLPAPELSPSESEAQANKPWVLVVEDNTETQRLLDVYLKQRYNVAQATNADEAFEHIQKHKPDVILMDVNLPGKDGLSITRDIRKGTICPTVPIVAVTAFAMSGDEQRCLDAGCDSYLSKPATKREVLDIVSKMLEKPH